MHGSWNMHGNDALQPPQPTDVCWEHWRPSPISWLPKAAVLVRYSLVCRFHGQADVCPALAAPGAPLPLRGHVKLNPSPVGCTAIIGKQGTGTALSGKGKIMAVT